jgi:hypothetical protein
VRSGFAAAILIRSIALSCRALGVDSVMSNHWEDLDAVLCDGVEFDVATLPTTLTFSIDDLNGELGNHSKPNRFN